MKSSFNDSSNTELAPIVSELGPTSQLPFDVLLNVFSHIDSFLDRLRVAKVNKRFRKCIFKAMKTPQPLKLDFEKDLFCADKLTSHKWPAVIQVLVKEARFSQIEITSVPNHPNLFPEIYETLVSSPECLSQLTAFSFSTPFATSMPVNSMTGLDLLLAKCAKLSFLKLSPLIKLLSPPDPLPETLHYPTLDLASPLRDKPVAEMNLFVEQCTHQQVIDILHALQPNSLRKLSLCFRNSPLVNLVLITGALCHTAAESIEEIYFFNVFSDDSTVGGPLGQLFHCIPHLPALRRLWLDGNGIQRLEQFVPAVKLLVCNHARTTPVVVEYTNYEGVLSYIPCCELLALIQPLLDDVPGTVFCLDVDRLESPGVEVDDGWKWKISLGNVSLMLTTDGMDCENLNCRQCHSCFPVVIHSLAMFANEQQSGHLENYWLDRCRIENVTKHPNMRDRGALDAVENAAHDLATIYI